MTNPTQVFKSTVCLSERETLLPGVQHTHQEQDQSHNTLGIPPLNNTVLTGGGGAVQADDAEQAWVTFTIFGENIILYYS